MKKNRKKSSVCSEAKSKTGKSKKPQQPEVIPFPDLVARENIADLQRTVRRLAKRDGARASALMRRLNQPLDTLQHLHQLAGSVLNHEPEAAVELRSAIKQLIQSHPHFSGGRQRLADRARSAPKQHANFDQTRLIQLGGLAGIYMGAAMAYRGGAGLTQAFDVIAGLSDCHGYLEVARATQLRGGDRALNSFLLQNQALNWGASGGEPGPGNRHGPDGGPAGDPWGPGDPIDPEGDPWGPGIDPGFGPGSPCPPPPEIPEELVRSGCEDQLLQILEEGAPSIAWYGRITAFADGIESIVMEGPCAGQLLIIHGSGFGNTQPENRLLVLHVSGRCRVVEADSWSDTEIVITLPNGVEPGPVGFYDPMGVNAWNQFAGQANADTRSILTASRCLGAPLLFPEWPAIRGIPCPPDIGINYLDVGNPLIHLFEADSRDDEGLGEVGDSVLASPGDVVVLRWLVERAETLSLRRVSNDGPDFGGNPEVTISTGSAWTLEPLAHDEPALFTYELEASNECGVVRQQVRILASKRPQLEITHAEITQGVQTEQNDVVLVAEKRTGVRLFATHQLDGFGGLDQLPGVRGRIRVREHGNNPWWPWMDAVNGSSDATPNPGVTIDLPVEPDRREIEETLNFVIPFTLCFGAIDIQIQARVDDAAAPPGERGYQDSFVMTIEAVEFEARAKPFVRYIPATIVITDTTPAVFFLASNPPTNSECTEVINSAYQRYLPAVPGIVERHPTLSVTIGADAWVISTPVGNIDIPPGWSDSNQFDILGNTNLEWLQLIRACQFLDVTGFLCPDEDDAIWTLLTPIGSWGRALPESNILLSPVNQETLAHEIGHIYGQSHLAITCPDDDSPPAANPLDETTHPDYWVDGGEVTDVVWDIDNNTLIFATDDEAGRVFDLMTYCTRRWTHPQRWQMMFEMVGE
ncbi:MAG: IPT/TIG domain-containing protein [Candidatus Thiodiazotropha sp. DIVDIV]